MSVVRPAPSLFAGRPQPTDRRGGGPGDAQSQSLSRSYGSVLPTSLTHIVPSARGFSPRRPAAVVGTTDETSHAGRPPAKGSDELGPADFQGSSVTHRTPHQWRRSAGGPSHRTESSLVSFTKERALFCARACLDMHESSP